MLLLLVLLLLYCCLVLLLFTHFRCFLITHSYSLPHTHTLYFPTSIFLQVEAALYNFGALKVEDSSQIFAELDAAPTVDPDGNDGKGGAAAAGKTDEEYSQLLTEHIATMKTDKDIFGVLELWQTNFRVLDQNHLSAIFGTLSQAEGVQVDALKADQRFNDLIRDTGSKLINNPDSFEAEVHANIMESFGKLRIMT